MTLRKSIQDPIRPPAVSTWFKLGYTPRCLYIGVRAAEPDMARIKARGKDGDSQLWSDDSIELFYRPRRIRAQYLQLVINANGGAAQSAQRQGQGPLCWTGFARAHRADGYYSVEIEIPF